MRNNRMLALVAQRGDEPQQAGPEDLYTIGTVAIIHQLMRASDGTVRLIVQGLERIRLLDFVSTEAYLVATTSLLDGPARQEILELDPVEAKLRRLIEILQHEESVRELGQQIAAETQGRMSKAQREYFLREQLRSIQQELGQGGDDPEIDELRRKIAETTLPQDVRREAERELERLATIPPASPEHGIIRTYLDWIAELPWDRLSGGEIDIARARQVLDEDHYDLEKIKDRILEYLAVRKLRG